MTSFVFLCHISAQEILMAFHPFPGNKVHIPQLESRPPPPPCTFQLDPIYLPIIIFYGSLSYALLSSQQFFPCLLLIIHITYTSIHIYFSQSSLLSTNLYAPYSPWRVNPNITSLHKTSLLIRFYLPPLNLLTSSENTCQLLSWILIIYAHKLLYSTRL